MFPGTVNSSEEVEETNYIAMLLSAEKMSSSSLSQNYCHLLSVSPTLSSLRVLLATYTIAVILCSPTLWANNLIFNAVERMHLSG